MAQAVFKRNGNMFKAFIAIVGNANDTISTSGPDSKLPSTIKLDSTGVVTYAIGKKGVYSFSAIESGISTTVTVDNPGKTYTANVNFITP